MVMLCKFAVYVYCMEKMALLLFIIILLLFIINCHGILLADASVSSSFIANATEADFVLWEEINIQV